MLAPETFREVMASWPTGVTVVAYRDEQRVVATTVSAFLSLCLEPPRILVALGPNSTVRPYLAPGASFGVSILGGAQRRLATAYADPFPVGVDDPFPPSGAPLIDGAIIGLDCAVSAVRETAGHAIVIADVLDAVQQEAPPLIRYRRKYHSLDT